MTYNLTIHLTPLLKEFYDLNFDNVAEPLNVAISVNPELTPSLLYDMMRHNMNELKRPWDMNIYTLKEESDYISAQIHNFQGTLHTPQAIKKLREVTKEDIKKLKNDISKSHFIMIDDCFKLCRECKIFI